MVFFRIAMDDNQSSVSTQMIDIKRFLSIDLTFNKGIKYHRNTVP